MVVPEIAQAALESLKQNKHLLAWLLLGALLLVVLERVLANRLTPTLKRIFGVLALIGGIGAGLVLAWKIVWLCDDAFISFRYARNFAHGNGLVFNPGEWVEGYTNFLWTFVLGWLGRAHVSIPHAALFGNLACYVLAIVLVASTVRQSSPKPGIFPFAAVALALSRPFHTFASSGLETMPAAMLVALGMWASLRKHAALASGLALVAATLTRPDHILIYACMGMAFIAEDVLHGESKSILGRLHFRRYVTFAAPVFLIYVPYFAWRWHAYGDFYPNTYYAKSGGGAYWNQGGIYLVHFLFTTGALVWLPLFIAVMVGRARSRAETRLRAFAILSVALHGLYVVKVGGDFMEHRFFISLLPIIAAAVEVAVRFKLQHAGPFARFAGALHAIIALAFTALPLRVLKPYEKRWNLAEENTFYPLKTVFPLKSGSNYASLGEKLHNAFIARGLKPKLAMDSIGLVGWYADLPIVDVYGLANRRVAHKEIKHRGRPGHEKRASLEDLLAEGAIVDTGNPWGDRFRNKTRAIVDNFTFHFIRWDPEVTKTLGAIPGAVLPDPARDIAEALRTASRSELIETRDFYRQFLLHHPDKERLLAQFDARLDMIADFEDSLPKGARKSGDGFRIEPNTGVWGRIGKGHLSSLPDAKSAMGTVEIDLGILAFPEMRFYLGGASSPKVRVELVVESNVARSASPRADNKLVPEAWSIAEFKGKRATLRIVDEESAPNVGLRLDGVHWGRADASDVRVRLRAGIGDAAELLRNAETELPETDPDVVEFSKRFALHERFDTVFPAGAEVTGTAFGEKPVSGALGGQSPVADFFGAGFLNSYHGGDQATGKIRLPEMVLTGQPIHVLVGGGRDCNRTYVGLEVEGRIVNRVCGKNDEVLRPAILATSAHVGKSGRVVFVDEATGNWAHLLADDLLVTAKPAAKNP